MCIRDRFTDVEDMEGLEKDTEFAKSLGFAGKAVISPRHVDIVNAVFSPTESEIEYAHDVMDAIEDGKRQGKGVISLRGKMIDCLLYTSGIAGIHLFRKKAKELCREYKRQAQVIQKQLKVLASYEEKQEENLDLVAGAFGAVSYTHLQFTGLYEKLYRLSFRGRRFG